MIKRLFLSFLFPIRANKKLGKRSLCLSVSDQQATRKYEQHNYGPVQQQAKAEHLCGVRAWHCVLPLPPVPGDSRGMYGGRHTAQNFW